MAFGRPAGHVTAKPRLSLATLGSVPERYRPRADPRALPVRMVHLGPGAFHRAHQAVYTEDAVAASGDEWGICGITQRSADVVGQLGPQDGLYSLSERDASGSRLRVIGTLREVLWAKEERERALSRLSDPATALITLTVTEKGYRRDPATGRLLTSAPDVVADLAGRPPETVVGQLAEGFARRAQRGSGPVTVLCCDNLPSNGAALRAVVLEFCERRPDARHLVDWVAENVTFPSCVVDRIVPATAPEDRDRASGELGVEDQGAVVAEPFRQWVIEDLFAAARPAWERAGAVFTTDVAPYEKAKLRMLNGAHSTIAYLGALAGEELVSAAVNGAIGEAARRLMADDVVPTLTVPDGFDVGLYERQLMGRFANPALRHRTLQIAMDGSQKLPQRLLGTIAERRAQGALPQWACLGVAAWMRCMSARRSDRGQRLEIEDPVNDRVTEALEGREDAASVVPVLLGFGEIFPAGVRDDKVVRDMLVQLVGQLAGQGARRTAQDLVNGAGLA